MRSIFTLSSGFRLREIYCFILLSVFLTGCQWVGVQDRETPRVEGRVLDAITHQPIAGVTVQAVVPGQTPAEQSAEKGAQRLARGQPVMTDTTGKFVFPGRDYITFIKSSAWWSCTLSFQRDGYYAYQTNFNTAQISPREASGVPVVKAGDILLQPLSK